MKPILNVPDISSFNMLFIFIRNTNTYNEICNVEILLPNENENFFCHILLFGCDKSSMDKFNDA